MVSGWVNYRAGEAGVGSGGGRVGRELCVMMFKHGGGVGVVGGGL